MNSLQLRTIREFELSLIVRELPPGARVLEVGAGSGWQSHLLSRQGFHVEAVDLAGASFEGARMWPVREFDGLHLPFGDCEFDAVFSSNVLEHVEDLQGLLRDTQRVLRPGSIAVHVVPTSAWRIWTSLVHYAYLPLRAAQRAGSRCLRRLHQVDRRDGSAMMGRSAVTSRWQYFRRLLSAERHGAHGGALWEIYGFSKHRWRREFSAARQKIIKWRPTGLYYSGYGLLPSLTLASRRRLSRVLGSACHVFVLQPKGLAGLESKRGCGSDGR